MGKGYDALFDDQFFIKGGSTGNTVSDSTRGSKTALTTELVDADGASVKIPLDRFRESPPILRTKFSKLFNEGSIWGKDYEPTMQTFELPLSLFLEENQDLDPVRLKEIRFVFDQTPMGVVFIDRLGFTSTR